MFAAAVRVAPARVRETLGIEKDDVYAWMSEHSHPRFAGFQLTTYNTLREGEEEWKGVMHLGELPFELPHVLLATTMPGLGLMNISWATGHVVVKKDVALTWPKTMRQVGETLSPGFAAVDAALPSSDDDERDEVRTRLGEGLAQAIAAARELEEIADEVKREGGAA